MSLTEIIITALALGIIVGGIYVLKKSARKFNLTAEQLKKIKERNKILDKEEQEEKTK